MYTMSLAGGYCVFFFFNDTATTEIYTLSLHDALPISLGSAVLRSAEQFSVGRERSRLVAALHLHARFGRGCGSPGAQVHAQPVGISLDHGRAPRGRGRPVPTLIGRVCDWARRARDRGGGNALLELRDPVGQIGG